MPQLDFATFFNQVFWLFFFIFIFNRSFAQVTIFSLGYAIKLRFKKISFSFLNFFLAEKKIVITFFNVLFNCFIQFYNFFLIFLLNFINRLSLDFVNAYIYTIKSNFFFNCVWSGFLVVNKNKLVKKKLKRKRLRLYF
jgi:hypothetical protein